MSRRQPRDPERVAATFAAPGRFLFLCLLAWLLAAGPLLEARPTTARPPPTAIRIGGVEYVDATNYSARHGLKLQPSASGRDYFLRGRGITVTLGLDNRECRVGAQRVYLGEPVRLYRGRLCFSRVDAERLLLPIFRPGFQQPRPARVRVIALDPGHGGRDPGKGNARLKVDEKTLALDTAHRLAKLLQARGFKVVMTRAGDKFVELEDRPAAARRLGADLFLSLHYNAAATPLASGLEVYTLTPQYQYSTSDTGRDADAVVRAATPGNRLDHWNTVLGYQVHQHLLRELKVADRGLRRARFAVLRTASCPAVLVEAGYLSNDPEARKIATPAYRQQIAAAIAKGVLAYVAAADGPRVPARK